MSRGVDLFARESGWKVETLQSATILVAGVGALGNEVLKNLALLGVGRLILVDFDHVEHHNLSRSVLFRESSAHHQLLKVEAAAEALINLNPSIDVVMIPGDLATDLGLAILSEVDLAFGCLDNRLARLYLNRLCWKAGIPWVDAGILQLGGQVCSYVPGDSCYECQLSSSEWSDIRARMGCADVARQYINSGRMPTTPIAASIIGGIQVQEGLKLLHESAANRRGGVMFSYEGATLQAGQYQRLGLKSDCLAHYDKIITVQAETISHQSTLAEVFTYCSNVLGLVNPKLRLGHDVWKIQLKSKGRAVLVPKHRIDGRLLKCLGMDANLPFVAERGAWVHEIDSGSDWLGLRLWQLGISFGGALEILGTDRPVWIGLGQDLLQLCAVDGVFKVPDPWRDFSEAELQDVLERS